MAEDESGNAATKRFYDLNEIARFFRRVAVAEVVAESTLLKNDGVMGGGIHIETLKDKHVLDARSLMRAQIMMTRFSAVCVNGKQAEAQAFLEFQQQNYLRACRQINRSVAESQELNAMVLRTVSSAYGYALVTHGTTKILSAVLSPFAGNALTVGASIVDSIIRNPTSAGVTLLAVQKGVTIGAKGLGDSYWSKATRTLSNIIDRDWKYPGALLNAQLRLKTQAGVVAGTAAVRVAFAAYGAYKGAKEIKQGLAELAKPNPSVSLEVLSAPTLGTPNAIYRPAKLSKETANTASGKDTPSSKPRTDWSALDEAVINGYGL
jgi:hypothetical protein